MTKAFYLIVFASLAGVHAECRAELMGLSSAADVHSAAPIETSTATAAETASPATVADSGTAAARAEGFPIDIQRELLPHGDVIHAPETAGALDGELASTPVQTAPGESAYADLWDRIRDNFGLSAVDNGRVTRQVEWFENHQNYVARLADRSRKYLYFIVDEVQKRGMPSEVALLPIVESAFNPTALSPAKASGIWQFMPSTGKLYGLRQNWWYDGRRDVVAATNGALDYLEKLHAQFGAWDLALAAYNCGEGAVTRAIERNHRAGKPTDYASLPLPEETRNYVPKLLAAREIISDPEAHGLNLPLIPDTPYFAAVTTHKHVDLAVAARFAGLSVAEFLTLNPGYSRPLIMAQGEQTILVPIDVAETFKARLNDPAAKLVSWRTHRLRRGESYASVASRFGMSSDELKRVNGISAHRRVAGGGTILVRDAQADEGDLDALSSGGRSESEIAAPTETVTFSHRVRRGESLASIARSYNVGVASLRTWNRISRSQGARLGQILVMHRTGETGEASLRTGLGDATVLSTSNDAAGAAGTSSQRPRAAGRTGIEDGPFESTLVEAAHSAKSHGHRHGHSHRRHAGKSVAGAPKSSALAHSPAAPASAAPSKHANAAPTRR